MAWYKQAFSTNKVVNNETKSKLQDEWVVNLGDFQRAPTDAYQCFIHVSETNYKISVCISIMTQHTGTMMLQMFWKYGLDERSAAQKTYNKLKSMVADIVEEIAMNEAPSSLFEGMVRSDCGKVDIEHIAKTNIPHINWTQDVKYERDWRSSLYGNRYPGPSETNGF